MTTESFEGRPYARVKEAGLYDLPMSAYLADCAPEPSLSRGAIETINNRSVLHAKTEHPRLGQRPESNSPRADLGSAVHGLVLGGAERIVYVDSDAYRTNDAKEARDKAYEENKIPMLAKFEEPLGAIADAALRSLAARGYTGDCEQTAVWKLDNGIWARVRPDMICHDAQTLIDLKTADNGDPGTWVRRSLFAGGYDIGARLYQMALEEITGRTYDYVWAVQEIQPPYCMSFVGAGQALLDLADRKIKRAAEMWAAAVKSGQWTGYTDEIVWAEPPAWAMWDLEERELTGGA